MEPGAERARTERDQIVVEVAALGNHDKRGDARPLAAPGGAFGGPLAAPGGAFGGPLAFGVVVEGDDQAREAGRRGERSKAADRERGGAGGPGHRGERRENRLDALAH